MPRVKWCYLLLHITPIEEPLGAQGRAHVFFAKMSGGGGITYRRLCASDFKSCMFFLMNFLILERFDPIF